MYLRKFFRFLLVLICTVLLNSAYHVNVMAACPPCDITSPSTLPSGVVGASYSYQFTATGQPPFSFFLDDSILTFPPAGLSLSSTGLLSGIPTTSETKAFVVKVQDSCAAGHQIRSVGFALTINTAAVSGSVAPSSYSVPSGITTSQSLTYTFTTTPAIRTTMVSSEGIFRVGSTQIGTNNVQISASVVNGRGSATEVITVRPSVIQQALSAGSSKMTYNRSFTNGVKTVDMQVEIRITTGTAADFRITRMQLYFQNRQPVITINRNDSALRTYAEINYVGSGLFQGHWEVDGNFLSNVIKTVTPGTTLIVESPAPPILPTFSSGSHRIRFVVTKPSQDISFPEISYYVGSEEPKPEEVKKLTPLGTLSPHNMSVINYEPTTFLWKMSNGVAVYFLEFFQKGEEKTIFAAYTQSPQYKLPATILHDFFSPGKTYTWKVRGFDIFNQVSAESEISTFTIRE